MAIIKNELDTVRYLENQLEIVQRANQRLWQENAQLAKVIADRKDHQPDELQRVSERLRKPVIDFCRANKAFRASELREYVEQALGQPIAPGSADRTLRALRSLGVLDYCVTNRRSGTYEVISA
jgi:hypothetical protein